MVVPSPVVPEAAWLIEDRLGPAAETLFLRFVSSKRVEIVDLNDEDYLRCIDLIEGYADLGLGFVDSSIVAIAERLGISTIATLDRRDFAVVRPVHCEAFDLVP